MPKKTMDFGQRMRRAREQYRVKVAEDRCLTQAELATLLKSTPAAVSHWESGARVPRAERIKQIAKVLGVDPNWLLGWDE